MQYPIKTAVFPVAGRGTRMMPFSLYVPKELMPLYDKPLIHYGVLEALSAGIEHFIMVIATGKEAIIEYLTAPISGPLLQRSQISVVYQDEQRGLGHAVGMAESVMKQRSQDLGEQGFLVIAPDDIMVAAANHKPAIAQLITEFCQKPACYSLIEQVPAEKTSSYGILKVAKRDGAVISASALVEKPKENPPSDFGIIARYCLPMAIFDAIRATQNGALGEIQLTDAMDFLIKDYGFFGVISTDKRFDCGNPAGLFVASQYFFNK